MIRPASFRIAETALISAAITVRFPVTFPSLSFTSISRSEKISEGRVTSTAAAGLFSASTSEAASHMHTARTMLRLMMNTAYISPPRHPIRPSRRVRMGR